MNLQQLQYIAAIDTHRHFARAAEACHVTQATLSMMVQKLEAELQVQLFDRSRQPVVPTPMGERVVAQARVVLQQVAYLHELVHEERTSLVGEVRLGIIPTLAPYLLPAFLRVFGTRHPAVSLLVSEFTTETLVQKLRNGKVDLAILSTPLHEPALHEEVLFTEPYLLYAGPNEVEGPLYPLPQDLDLAKLWLLEEGHCMRDQVLAVCQQAVGTSRRLTYQAGSIETLKNLVDFSDGYTLLPELATLQLQPAQHLRLRRFADPEPTREVSLVYPDTYPKRKMVAALKACLLEVLPPSLQNR